MHINNFKTTGKQVLNHQKREIAIYRSKAKMAKQNIKRCLNSLGMRKMQIETRYHIAPI